MNIKEIRREIFSYLRNDSKLLCYQCNYKLEGNKKEKSIAKNCRKPICRNCYFNSVGYPDLFTVFVLFFSSLCILFVIFKLFYNI